MNLPAQTRNDRLIFNWDAPKRRSLILAGFVAASVAAHAAGFYVFQIIYPPTVALLPPPGRVNLIYANSEEGQTALRRIEAEDPALMLATRRPAESRARLLPSIEHVPSYFSTEPTLKEAPPLLVDLRVPSAQPPGMVPVIRRHPPPAGAPVPTSVVFSNGLEELGAARLPPVNFKRSSNESPQNSRYQVAVDSSGVVRYCLMLSSSGDTTLDEEARNYLALCRFAPKARSDPNSLVWGTATIAWSNDVSNADGKSTATRTP